MREKELELPAHLRRREADEVQSILIRDEAEHGCAITPIAIHLPHIGNATHDIESFVRDGVQLRGVRPHDAKLDRERRVGPEHQLSDAHASLRRKPI